MINKVILLGYLGSDPEIRSTQSGTAVATFPLATYQRFKDRDDNRREPAEWHDIVCFARQADIARQYLTRGRLVYLEGRIHTQSSEDRDTGQMRYRTEIVCESFQMLVSVVPSVGSGTIDAEPSSHPEDDDARSD